MSHGLLHEALLLTLYVRWELAAGGKQATAKFTKTLFIYLLDFILKAQAGVYSNLEPHPTQVLKSANQYKLFTPTFMINWQE